MADIISIINGYNVFDTLIRFIIMSVGCFFLFKKCGTKPVWAIIPIAREYHLALCADDEDNGRSFVIVTACTKIISIILILSEIDFNSDNAISLILLIATCSLLIAQAIFKIRIYLALIKIFEKNKKWILAFVFFEEITVLIWGLSGKFVPKRKVEDLSESGAEELGQDVADEEGLTVNLNERITYDFFQKKTLLKDMHMNIPKGHMVLLLGGSGAGKTTFLNAITGYEKADAHITLGDLDVYDDYGKLIYDIGFVPQQDLIRGNDTVLLTLTDAAALRLPAKMPLKERLERVDKVLDQFGLTVVKNNLVDKLSGGQRKRVSIAMEYISDPLLFILDEPDSGLDGVVARSLFVKLREIADSGKIVIVITHTPDRVVDLFDDVIVLIKDSKRTGRLAFYGSVQESYDFFDTDSMEGILKIINPENVGGDGRGEEFVTKFSKLMKGKVG